MNRQCIFGLNKKLAKTIRSILEIPVYRFSLCFVLGLPLHPPTSFSSLLLQSSLSMTMASGFFSFVSTKRKMTVLYFTEAKTKYIFIISIRFKRYFSKVLSILFTPSGLES